MQGDAYYKAIAKAAEDWHRQNILALQKISVTPTHMLKNLESSMISFRNIQEQISNLSASIHPTESELGKNIREANLHMSAVLTLLKPYQNGVKQLQKNQYKWVESLRASSAASSKLMENIAALTRDFSLTTRSALLAQRSVVRLNLEAIKKTVGVTHQVQATLYQPILEMADSYRHLWDMFRIDSHRFFSVPLVVTEVPSIEMYLAAHQAEMLTVEAEILPDDEEFLAEIEPDVQHMDEIITSIDEQLLPLYHGAISAVQSNNVDHVRHAAISLRELFTYVLHKLAPDEAFFKWNQDKLNLDDKGRPTRKGRLLYICRNINYDPFTAFVDKDISAVLVLLDLLQKGTHAKKKPYNEKQLKVLLIRMEHLLDFIIRISRNA